jgi:hypothetical protein
MGMDYQPSFGGYEGLDIDIDVWRTWKQQMSYTQEFMN